MSDTAQDRSAAPIMAALLLGIVCVCALLVAMAGPGYRAGWWELGPAFALLRYAVYGAAAAGALSAILAVVALLRTPHRGLAAAALPLVIHMLTRRRPRRTTFSSIVFLREVRLAEMRRFRLRDERS